MKHTIHLVSDSTGETLSTVASAALALFETSNVDRRLHVFVRNPADTNLVIEDIRRAPGLVLITMVDRDVKARIVEAAERLGATVLPVLDPLVSALEDHLSAPASRRPGGQYAIDDLYFRRVDAIEFAINNDDGAAGLRFRNADVILTGVSRTSKTPTCIYLACRGVKAANLPLVPGVEPPEGFKAAVASGVPVIGLTASPTRLAQIRRQRLDSIGHDQGDDYAALDQIRSEVAEARLLFDRIGAPVIDVTRRSIEETAASVMAILREREPA